MLVHACGSRCAREGTSSEADPARGRRGPSSEADLARGGALLGRFGGPCGPPRRGLCCVCFVLGSRCVCVFSGFKQDSPDFFDPRGCPRHFAYLFRSWQKHKICQV
jgi:hypothetical protein